MSRRTDLLQKLIASNKLGTEKEQEQQFLMATAELILSDLLDIAMNGIEKHGAGSLIINLINDSTTFMSGHAVEYDIAVAEREGDDDVLEFLRGLMEEIDTNDWSKNVLITLISDVGTRTFACPSGGSQESLRALLGEFK